MQRERNEGDINYLFSADYVSPNTELKEIQICEGLYLMGTVQSGSRLFSRFSVNSNKSFKFKLLGRLKLFP
jgi:hypothetical protein